MGIQDVIPFPTSGEFSPGPDRGMDQSGSRHGQTVSRRPVFAYGRNQSGSRFGIQPVENVRMAGS
jgi:hypothetical protein